jgi:hypothetical protein
MKLYRYDSETMTMTRFITKKVVFYFFLIISSLMLMSFYIGTKFGSITFKGSEPKENQNIVFASKYDTNPEHDMAWKDSTFKEYKIRADLFLNRPIFEGTPLNGDILSLCARNAYDSTGIIVPLELALSQAQWESGMGREGKSPKNNPFNIGETDNGTVLWFDSTFEGTQAYYYMMCKNYLRCKSVEELFSNFTNCQGKRYASGETYQNKVREQYYSIKSWIDKNRKK